MDAITPEFIAASATLECFIAGRFIDQVFPALEWLPDEASNNARAEAVSRFSSAVAAYDARRYVKIGAREDGLGENWFSDDELRKGYKCRQIPLDQVAGLTLIKNGRVLAFTSAWQPQSIDVFLRAIVEHVMMDTHGSQTGFSCLELLVSCCHDYMTINHFPFRQIYSDVNRRSPADVTKERESISNAFVDFISKIYIQAHIIPADYELDADDVDEYTPDHIMRVTPQIVKEQLGAAI